jgi:hypothetical protein
MGAERAVMDYLAARQALAQATARMEALVQEARKAVELLPRWRESNPDRGQEAPAGAAPPPDLSKWPSADQLSEGLRAFWQARAECQRAWEKLPADLRAHLQNPESAVRR